MMYLIKKDDKYIVMASDMETIKKYCGDDFKIILFWEEDKQEESLRTYFSNMKMDSELLELYVIAGILKIDINRYIDKYYEEDMEILNVLSNIDVITSREKDELTDISDVSKKKQLELVNRYYTKK